MMIFDTTLCKILQYADMDSGLIFIFPLFPSSFSYQGASISAWQFCWIMSYCFYTTLISFSIFQFINGFYWICADLFTDNSPTKLSLNGIHRYHCYQAFHQSIIRSSCGSFTCPPSPLHPTTSILLQWKHLQDPRPDIVLCSPGRSPNHDLDYCQQWG